MPTDFFAVNGRVVPAAEATVSVLDLGFLRGVGAFETLRTYDGQPHAVSEHLRRLWDCAEAFDLAPFFSEGDVRRCLAEILAKSGHPDLRVNFVITPGEHSSGVFGGGKPTWVMIARDLHAPPPQWYEDGVSTITFTATRHLPTLKTTNYLSGKRGLQLAEARGAHEALYVDAAGYVTEGVTSNVLVVQGHRLMTPIVDCLAGITKAGLRPLAEAAGLTWYECRLTRDDLYTADEVWITSAVRELLPVVKVDDHLIHEGKVGPWAKQIRHAYHRACSEQARADAQRFAATAPDSIR
jgi:branched-chain amino acid aminotransferase